uniref:RxLR effector protein n=1 Tax=Minutocellus polymorphus TaxID=265543 RepID=A0A7S0ADH1_9STRA|mmetsp:Transcript_11620/g.19300  ORF Transcript_11620/g.19300 Transcript_11620/m.19300 type:complete len:116 (+) Transcript_11620:179-526(+)
MKFSQLAFFLGVFACAQLSVADRLRYDAIGRNVVGMQHSSSVFNRDLKKGDEGTSTTAPTSSPAPSSAQEEMKEKGDDDDDDDDDDDTSQAGDAKGGNGNDTSQVAGGEKSKSIV